MINNFQVSRDGNISSSSNHECTSHRDGDWVIWRCPYCSDPASEWYSGYERRYNLKSGEMVSKGTNDFTHSGLSQGKQSDITLPLIQNIQEN
mgnify:CR=1 FL=1